MSKLNFWVKELRASSFHSTEEICSAIEASSQPVLLVVEDGQLPDLLGILRNCDDVCLESDPQSVRDFRLQRLRQRQQCEGFDPLTNLKNRQSFMLGLHDLTMAASAERSVSLIMCDIDYFKHINDSHGHHFGDLVLRDVANCLKQSVGSLDSVGRLGGEEFGIASSCDEQQARVLAERLRVAVANCPMPTGTSVTVSLGIATARNNLRAGLLYEKATQALYDAKSKGRDQWCCFAELESESKAKGNDIEVANLETMARVLAERVANVITMRSRKLITHIRKEADVDGLTGCFNRRYLDRRLADEFDLREERPLSVAFLDLDHFGEVNKQFGWSTGDKLLVEVCNTIRGHIREGDWIGRYGGEEFCVVMPNTTAEESQRILARIRSAVEATNFQSSKDDDVPVTVSIGATNASENDRSFSEMLERASEMARKAKADGRNRVCIQSA